MAAIFVAGDITSYEDEDYESPLFTQVEWSWSAGGTE